MEARDERGESHRIAIPAERSLTVYLDKREIVTRMTLGAHPERLEWSGRSMISKGRVGAAVGIGSRIGGGCTHR